MKADDVHSSTEEDIELTEMISCSDYKGDASFLNNDTHQFSAEVPEKRDMYFNLYLKVNKKKVMPVIKDFDIDQIMDL